jgi:serine/threonine protein kinase
MAQLDHPCICKLLGIDSSHNQGLSMVFEFTSRTTLDTVCVHIVSGDRNTEISPVISPDSYYVSRVGCYSKYLDYTLHTLPNLMKTFQLKDIASALVYIHEHVNGPIAHGDIQPVKQQPCLLRRDQER